MHFSTYYTDLITQIWGKIDVCLCFCMGRNIHGYSTRPCACRLVSSVKKKLTLKLKVETENTPKLQKTGGNLRKKYVLLLRMDFIYI